MFKEEQIEFSREQEDVLRQAFGEDEFKYLNSKVNMYDEDASIEKKIEHIKKYIMYFCKSPSEDTRKGVERFFNLLGSYRKKVSIEPIRNDSGEIRLLDSGFNSCNAFHTGKMKLNHAGKGSFREGIFIATSGTEYIKKRTMEFVKEMDQLRHYKQLRYNPVIAHQVFDKLGQKCATYFPAVGFHSYYYVISENFLEENQELITFDDLYGAEEREGIKHSDVLKLLEDNIRIRYKNSMDENEYNDLFKKLQLQYIKQALVKKVIGLADDQLGNVGIVLTTTGEEMEIPKIDISPAFDLDMSFNIAEETQMYRFKTDNEKTDIKSFVEEFRHIEGFGEFISDILNTIKNEDEFIEDIINNSYETSKAEYFKNEDNRRDYKNYLKSRFQEIRQAYNELYLENREEEEK